MDEDDELDAARGWLHPVGEHTILRVPPEAYAPMAALWNAGGSAVPDDLAIEVDGPDGHRPLTVDERSRLVDDASATCIELVFADQVVLDDDQLVDLTHASSLLAQLWTWVRRLTDEPLNDATATGIGALIELAADCEEMFVTRIRRRPNGTFSLRWGVLDRRMLRAAFGNLRELLPTDDSSITRLFPSAYGDDAERNAGWDVLMRGELIDRRSAALDTSLGLLDRRSCDADDLATLMRCVNDARLVLGTRLDVSEDGPPDHLDRADLPTYLTYDRMSHVLAVVVDALEGAL